MSPKLRASIKHVLFAAGALVTTAPFAAPQQSDTTEIAEIVIVTGSYIRGTAEDAALPVDVISTEELEKQGAPSAIDMLKSLTVMNGIIGESNRFTSGRGQASQGSAEINLRGFGEARTLVLLNGKRLATGDANRLPGSGAIARVEILKDGGASTYGSDAIGGVVNFITKERVEGLELSADYRHIEDSDGDYTAGLTWGTVGSNWDFFVSGNYFHRSQLLARDRDWTLRSYAENPQGGWSTGSNPGSFIFRNAPTGTAPFGMLDQRADPACTTFGGVVITGVPSSIGAPAGTQCQTQFTQWDNLVEEQDSYQAFVQFNIDFSDTTRLHLEGLYAYTDVPNAGATPTATTTRPITSTVLPAGSFGVGAVTAIANPGRSSFFNVPLTNPGYAGIFAPGAAGGTVPATATQGYILINQWRPFLSTGNPAHADGTQTYNFERDHYRFSAELTTEFAGISSSTSLTYGGASSERREVDFSTARLQLALRGLGGPNCNIAANTPGANGCLWFNPFSTGIRTLNNGTPNPYYVASADVNSAALINWIEDDMLAVSEVSVAEFDQVFSGELPFSLPGGTMGWALGAQYRHQWNKSNYGDTTNRALNPCVDTPVTGATTCAPFGESPYNFLGTYNEIDVDRGVYAVFTELSLPIFDSLNAQLAARFEDYGNKGGSSFDPKLSVKYQVIDQLALRGSVSTTFRAPPLTTLIPDENLAFTSIFGTNRPVGTVGNPELEPEEAFQWSVGAIVNVGNFRAMIDFWRFDIDQLLGVEPTNGILNIVFPNGAPTTANPNPANNCATVDPAYLASRFTFANGVCAPGNILKITRSSINGAGLRNDGIDATLDYTFDNVAGGSLVIGASATWIHKYETETLRLNGVVYEQGFDGVGFLNQGTTLYALPEWRAQGYLDFNVGTHNVRWTTNFIDQYRDQRTAQFTATSPKGQVIDSTFLHNVTYRTQLPWDTTLLATIENITDEDPSFARLELNYDPLTGFPLGRTFKIGVRKTFQ